MTMLRRAKSKASLLVIAALLLLSVFGSSLTPTDTYASSPLVEGKDNTQPGSMAKPAKGVPFTDAVYGTTVVRATDHAADGASTFSRNDYSRRQAFNADSTMFITYSYNGHWHLYDADTYQRIRQLPYLAGDAEPQWHPTDPDLLYYLPNSGGLTINLYDAAANSTSVVADFTGRLPWPGAAHVFTRSEGAPSADGRYWGFMVDDASWNSLGLFTYDLQTDTILGTRNTNGNRPDHVSMSPTGDYMVVSWLAPTGTVAYSRDLSTAVRQLHYTSEHSDLALDTNGDDVYVSIDYSTNGGEVFMTHIASGAKTNLFDTYLGGTATALHISGRSFDKPGWALVSTYAPYLPSGTSRQWLMDKIFAVELTANPRIYNLAHHHVFNFSGYWTEPHATVNRDFTRVLFNSNWETSSSLDVDAYMIRLQPGDLPDAGGGSPTPTPSATPTPTPTPSATPTPTPSATPTPTPTPSVTPTPTPTPTPHAVELQQGVGGYTGGKDQSHLRETGPNEGHYGAGQRATYYLRDGGFVTNALIYFDLAGQLPTGATVQSATLSLYNTGTGAYAGGTVDLYRVTDPDGKGMWAEGNSSDYTVKNGSAWTRRTGTGNTVTTGWTNSSGSTIMNSVAGSASGTLTFGTSTGWTNSTDVTADVQAWLDGTSVNQGWYMRVRSGSPINLQDSIAGNQYGTAAYRPKLTITYTP